MRDIDALLAALPGAEVKEGAFHLPVEALPRAFESLKKLGGLMLFDISAVDRPPVPPTDALPGAIGRFEVSWRFLDLKEAAKDVITLRVCIDRDDPEVPSAVAAWKAADVLEREVWDLMGIRFSGRAQLERILNRADFVGHPLRKDFVIERRERFPEGSWAKKAAEGGQ
jgi:NADH-quinone oxidoreductase subunit C